MSYINKEEFAEMVKIYQLELYRLSFAILRNEADAQDAVGDAIVKAYEQRRMLGSKEKFKSWIMKIVVNTSKNMLRSKHQIVYIEDMPEMKVGASEKRDEVWDAVLELDYKHRVVVVLYYYECFSAKEISQMLHIPEGTIKSRLARAREKLKTLL